MLWFAIRNMRSVQVKYVWVAWEKCMQQKLGWCMWLLWQALRHYSAQRRLDCAWEANVPSPECRLTEQVRCPCSSLKAWVQTISYHICRRANSKSLWNTFLHQIHLSFHCTLEIHLQISVTVEMKKQSVSSLDVMNFRGVKKVGCGLCLWDFFQTTSGPRLSRVVSICPFVLNPIP